MAVPALSVEQQIKQLGDARKLVLSDTTYYPQIIQGILPIIGPSARVELQRWGADFIAETFASPTVSPSQKETLALVVLEMLQSYLDNQNGDTAVLKSVVQAAASIYPLVVRWIINNPYDTNTWDSMVAIKSKVFRLWDTSVPGVRVCSIKFAQRVVLVQTPGPDTDPRRGSPLDVSLTLVPANHLLLTPRNLEAEASGLLDRMLGVFQENSSDAMLIDATLNTLSILIRARPNTSNRILNVILNFNPLKQANSPMTPKLRVMVKSMEKTTRSLLVHILKRDHQHPSAGRIHQYIERMMRSRMEIFDEATKKRGLEPIENLDPAKRQKLVAQVSIAATRVHVPLLPPGSNSVADLFTVTSDAALKAFDVSQLSEDLVVKIGITILQRTDAETIDQTIKGIRERYTALNTAKSEELNPATAILGVEEDEDEYEPDFYTTGEDTEQILNKLDSDKQLEEVRLPEPDVALGPFKLPPSSPLTLEQTHNLGESTIARLFGSLQTLDESGAKKTRAGMNRLAASGNDRDSWITIFTRLATRSVAGLEDALPIKDDPDQSKKPSLNDSIRKSLYLYVLEDFRRRIDIAISWLCEEWYNDQIQRKLGDAFAVQHYDKWALKVLDGILPYLDAKDKILTRFLSEIPGLTSDMLERVKVLCRDPAMVNLALTSLLYLVMMRPPVREMVLDAVEDVWNTYEDAKAMASKYLTKWRPGFAERIREANEANIDEKQEDVKPNGVDVAAGTS